MSYKSKINKSLRYKYINSILSASKYYSLVNSYSGIFIIN